MPTSFPSIEPSSRSFVAPKWPTTSSNSMSGVTTRRLWGSRPSHAELKLNFNNIDDVKVSAILSAYSSAQGPIDSLVLPDILFNGADPTLKSWLDGGATNIGLLWCFAENSPPSVESIAPNRSNVQISLMAELRMS